MARWNSNKERGIDKIRLEHAADAVVDTAGVLNGRPGEIVCRVMLLANVVWPLDHYNPFDDARQLRRDRS